MRRDHLKYLVCPDCQTELSISRELRVERERLITAELACGACGESYPVLRGVPRFVPASNYSEGFGFQWKRHAWTQHDCYSRSTVSEDRFFKETRWPRSLPGETLLEVGCGSGRFTTHALSTDAMVVSVDMSAAVEENYRCHAGARNLLVVQADLYRLPLIRQSFDKVFCLGVLQHTPDVEKAFRTLPDYVGPNGKVAVDVYDKRSGLLGLIEPFYRTHRWIRPLTRRLPPRRLYDAVSAYITLMWPLAKWIHRIPAIGPRINRALLVVDYRGRYPLSEGLLKEWSILDTFDMLSPAYEQRQTIESVKRWFAQSPLKEVEVHYGYNGIEGRGTKC